MPDPLSRQAYPQGPVKARCVPLRSPIRAWARGQFPAISCAGLLDEQAHKPRAPEGVNNVESNGLMPALRSLWWTQTRGRHPRPHLSAALAVETKAGGVRYVSDLAVPPRTARLAPCDLDERPFGPSLAQGAVATPLDGPNTQAMLLGGVLRARSETAASEQTFR